MKTKLLSILLALSLALSFTACKNVSEAKTTDAETTEPETTEFHKPRIESPEWTVNASYNPYAIVTITGIVQDVEQLYTDGNYWQAFYYKLISSTQKSFPTSSILYVVQDPEQKIKPGDTIFFQIDSSNSQYKTVKIGSRKMSEYKIFTDSAIELTDNDLQGFFNTISVFNDYASLKREWSKPYDTDPSFPTKELCGKVTVEEASNFLDSVKKARDEYFAFWDDPESVNEYLHTIYSEEDFGID